MVWKLRLFEFSVIPVFNPIFCSSIVEYFKIKMEDSFEHPVYSPNVIEFVTVSREFCAWLEGVGNQSRPEFVGTALKILPLLYLKSGMLPKSESVLDEYLEKHVAEEDYEYIRYQVQTTMGRFDDYLEVFTADMQRSDLPLTSTISENMADIYQDVKDFLMSYRSAVTEIMNDALVELQTNFESYWGQRLVNVLRALHMVSYGGENIDDDEDAADEPESEGRKTDHWILSQRQREFQDDFHDDE